VDYWGIWNEPNERSWLTPWYQPLSGHGRALIQPIRYRSLVDAAWRALAITGHSHDTVMIGETANRGIWSPAAFTRALYCVGARLRPLRGSAAALVGCPSSGSRSGFVAAHPGLFRATYAHHPYAFNVAPNRPFPDPTFVTLYSVPAFERMLSRIFGAYGPHPSGGVPLYLTEWGYKTNPPNPYSTTSPAQQAAWINEGQYLTWREPYVRGLTQFLLVDYPPKPHSRRNSALYWSTFQTGLEYMDGSPKPSFNAFRVPIWLPVARHGGSVEIWGQLRSIDGSNTQSGEIDFQPQGSGSWQPIAAVQAGSPAGFFDDRVSIPGPGLVRLTWSDASGTVLYSRSVPVS
jgi:hypothetical protein